MRYLKREGPILHGTFHGRLYGFGTDLKAVSKFEFLLMTMVNFHFKLLCRLWAEIEVHKWRDLELNLSKTVEELRQDSQLIQANSMKKLRDNKKLLECSFAQI